MGTPPATRRHVRALIAVWTLAMGGSIVWMTLQRGHVWVAALYGLLWGAGIVAILLSGRRLADEESRRVQSEAALQRSEERYRSFVAFSSDGIWCFHLETPLSVVAAEEEQIAHLYRHARIGECNAAMARQHGFADPREMEGLPFGALIPRLSQRNLEDLRRFLRAGYRSERNESQQIDRTGNVRYCQSSLTGIVEQGFLVRIWGVQHDITEIRRLTEQLETMSLTDPLTGLCNRRGFMTLTGQQLRVADRTKQGFLLLFLDLDGLKGINDRLGHARGDEALREMAALLRKCFRESDITARLEALLNRADRRMYRQKEKKRRDEAAGSGERAAGGP